jgi:hypothetical protein
MCWISTPGTMRYRTPPKILMTSLSVEHTLSYGCSDDDSKGVKDVATNLYMLSYISCTSDFSIPRSETTCPCLCSKSNLHGSDRSSNLINEVRMTDLF